MGVRSIEDIEPDEAPAERIDRPRAAAILQRSELTVVEPPAVEAAPAPAPAPALPAEPVTRAVLPVSDPQLRKLGVLFGELGVKGRGERADRLAIASAVAGRELSSSKDLTMDEAGVLIDTLEGSGRSIVDEVLGRAETSDDNERDHLHGSSNEDEIDPTTGDDWPMDGAEAAAEGL